MRGRIFNLASAVSLFLCLTMAVVWVRSYWCADVLYWSRLLRVPSAPERQSFEATESNWGHLEFVHTWREQTPSLEHVEPQVGAGRRSFIATPGHGSANRMGWLWCGFGGWSQSSTIYGRAGQRMTQGSIGFCVPHWLVILLLALPAAHRVQLHSRRRRTALSCKCRLCGYDLRASPQRCPECGTPASIHAAIAGP